MIEVSNAGRVVFPEVNRTKGDVVSYYERIAPLALPHVAGRPLSLRRYPKGLAGTGFFQKNVPPHYPASIERFPVPRSQTAARRHAPSKGGAAADVTVYPVVHEAWHLPYVANQGAIELHVPTARAATPGHPDRLIIDLDPPPGALALVRRAARITREALAALGLETALMATGSKGYHVAAPLLPTVSAGVVAVTLQKLATLLAARHPDELTTAFRVADRGERVFVDWLRNTPQATAVAPYSLRARPRATVAAPLSWDELDALAPDAFTLDDVDRLLERLDPIARLAAAPADLRPVVERVAAEFELEGLELESFDRFRS
jgi:bifunctional non-homologous end joining protein LigD